MVEFEVFKEQESFLVENENIKSNKIMANRSNKTKMSSTF